jgi:CubicO group peptidase (beta-lactamase class C family)
MQLVERGQLDLDVPIQTYCPSFPAKQWPVTARQLLGHMSGVRHYAKPGESIGTAHFFSIAESLAPFKDDPLQFEPGTKYEYTTFGFSVLGCAIEGAAKMTYEQFVMQNIAGPAGMTHTAVDDLYRIVPGRVRGYQVLTEQAFAQLPAAVQAIARPNTVYNASLHDTSMKIPGGGWLSTSSDMVRFGMAMLQSRLVKPATRDQMWTSQKTPDGKETGYGFGFGVQTRDGLPVISHSGNQAGASSAIRISPNRQAVVVVMTNLEDAPVSEIINAVIAAMPK